MQVVNSHFNFTVKIAGKHYTGQFNYAGNGCEIVKLSTRCVNVDNELRPPTEHTVYLKKLYGKWILWDMKRQAPRRTSSVDDFTYSVFKEAYGLSLLSQ